MRHDSKFTRETPPKETAREWLSGLLVVIATVVAFIGFAHASLVWTLVISTLILVGLAGFLWSAGGGKKRS